MKPLSGSANAARLSGSEMSPNSETRSPQAVASASGSNGSTSLAEGSSRSLNVAPNSQAQADNAIRDKELHADVDEEAQRFLNSPTQIGNGHGFQGSSAGDQTEGNYAHGRGVDEEENEDDEEDEEDEDEEEPALKYERITGAIPDLFKKDSASALCVSQKIMASNQAFFDLIKVVMDLIGVRNSCWYHSHLGPLRETY